MRFGFGTWPQALGGTLAKPFSADWIGEARGLYSGAYYGTEMVPGAATPQIVDAQGALAGRKVLEFVGISGETDPARTHLIIPAGPVADLFNVPDFTAAIGIYSLSLTQLQWWVSQYTSHPGLWRFGRHTNGKSNSSGDQTSGTSLLDGPVLAEETWHHMMMGRDDDAAVNELEAYTNGAVIGSGADWETWNGASRMNTYPLVIGALLAAASYPHCHGHTGYFAFWNVRLDNTEKGEFYDGGSPLTLDELSAGLLTNLLDFIPMQPVDAFPGLSLDPWSAHGLGKLWLSTRNKAISTFTPGADFIGTISMIPRNIGTKYTLPRLVFRRVQDTYMVVEADLTTGDFVLIEHDGEVETSKGTTAEATMDADAECVLGIEANGDQIIITPPTGSIIQVTSTFNQTKPGAGLTSRVVNSPFELLAGFGEINIRPNAPELPTDGMLMEFDFLKGGGGGSLLGRADHHGGPSLTGTLGTGDNEPAWVSDGLLFTPGGSTNPAEIITITEQQFTGDFHLLWVGAIGSTNSGIMGKQNDNIEISVIAGDIWVDFVGSTFFQVDLGPTVVDSTKRTWQFIRQGTTFTVVRDGTSFVHPSPVGTGAFQVTQIGNRGGINWGFNGTMHYLAGWSGLTHDPALIRTVIKRRILEDRGLVLP